MKKINNLKKRLANNKIIIMDSGMGSEIHAAAKHKAGKLSKKKRKNYI